MLNHIHNQIITSNEMSGTCRVALGCDSWHLMTHVHIKKEMWMDVAQDTGSSKRVTATLPIRGIWLLIMYNI